MAKASTLLPPGVPEAGGAPQEDRDAKPLPKFGTPIPAVVGEPLPRICKELERAPKGASRFKVRASNYPDFKGRYLLVKDKNDAADEDAAKAFFLTASGLAAHVEKLKATGDTPLNPLVVVTVLDD